jgi:hypothetical protein
VRMQDMVKSAITIERRHGRIFAIRLVLYRETQVKSNGHCLISDTIAYLKKTALAYILQYRYRAARI